MKFQVAVIFALLGSVAAQSNATNSTEEVGDNRSPVTRVVDMLEDLKAKILSDQKTEEQMYNKYACWCEKTSHRKAADINEAEADLRSLGQMILKLKGEIQTLAAEIKELEERIEETEKTLAEATSIREKKNKAFMEESDETKQALAALEKAIKVLKAATSGDGESLLQSDAAAQASAVRNVLDKLPGHIALNGDKVSFLSNFASNGMDGTYAPQSATIQGMLVEMYSNFGKSLEEATMTEAMENHKFEALSFALEEKIADAKESKSRKEDQKVQAESDLADTTKTYDDTQDQMKADMKFFDETKASCTAKYEEWMLRQKARVQELDGVEEALHLLTGDQARELFAKSIKPGQANSIETPPEKPVALLQINSDNAQAVAATAYNMLKAKASKAHSLRLAALAVRVRNAKVGHFDKVIEEIDIMIKVLAEEGEADRAKKDQCNEEYQKIALTVQDLDWKIKNNHAKIDKDEAAKEKFEKQKAKAIEKIHETHDHMHSITENRHAEHAEFLEAQEADHAAVELLNMAKDALTKFYKNHSIDVNSSLIQEEPAFARSKDDAPDADFSGKGNRAIMTKGAVSMMTMIIQDLEDEIKNDAKAEAESQTAYEEEMKTAEELVKDLEAKVTGLEEMIAKKVEDIEKEHESLHHNTHDRDEEISYKNQITADCDWIKKNFDDRAAARAAEHDGLVSAKEFLAGKQALLQLKVEVPIKEHDTTNNKLANINFLGLH